jgi:polyferredoxin
MIHFFLLPAKLMSRKGCILRFASVQVCDKDEASSVSGEAAGTSDKEMKQMTLVIRGETQRKKKKILAA